MDTLVQNTGLFAEHALRKTSATNLFNVYDMVSSAQSTRDQWGNAFYKQGSRLITPIRKSAKKLKSDLTAPRYKPPTITPAERARRDSRAFPTPAEIRDAAKNRHLEIQSDNAYHKRGRVARLLSNIWDNKMPGYTPRTYRKR